jgi:hypothetical protein
MGGITGAEGIRRAVRANLSRGVDWIKVLATERAGTPNTDPRKQVYSQEEAADPRHRSGRARHPGDGARARRRGRGRRGARGVRSIEHGTYLTMRPCS